MGFDIALGIALAAVGTAILVLALAHPAPQSVALIRLFAWPRTDQDRTDLLLSGGFYIAIGAVLAALATEASLALLLAPVAALLITGIALGLRHRGA